MSDGTKTLKNDQIMNQTRNIFESKSDSRIHEVDRTEIKHTENIGTGRMTVHSIRDHDNFTHIHKLCVHISIHHLI